MHHGTAVPKLLQSYTGCVFKAVTESFFRLLS